ncbi:hypothetical protein F5050DRAFT_1780023 [Lentinula boryana]|uniref:Thioredoxin-like protein n=1 Tax=Lentinula boryana TaxID=40481 RepID=A0ABQ8Q5C2_9AGAR|nr:hypothetical protein F5050DRAFT_1780023 [Lentinula boryana]
MKVFWLPLIFLSLNVNGQYFSEGWKPGQAVTSESSAPLPTGVPSGTGHSDDSQKSQQLSVDGILNSPWISSLFAKAGVNISSIASTVGLSSKAAYPWDPRIPLITDTNFDDMIVDEELTLEEERNRTWLIVVSTSATNKGGGISQFVDRIFDETYNETLTAGDLPDLRWGRIDYLNVTYLTTKWGVWQAPTFVILQNRGQTLRFVKPQWLRLHEGALRTFLTTGMHNELPPWDSSFAPGGSNEYILHYMALVLMKFYNVVIKVPGWIMYIASGSLASFIIHLLHRPTKKDEVKAQAALNNTHNVVAAPVADTTVPSAAAASGSTATARQVKQRKSKK